jgi:hypothetical protein
MPKTMTAHRAANIPAMGRGDSRSRRDCMAAMEPPRGSGHGVSVYARLVPTTMWLILLDYYARRGGDWSNGAPMSWGRGAPCGGVYQATQRVAPTGILPFSHSPILPFSHSPILPFSHSHLLPCPPAPFPLGLGGCRGREMLQKTCPRCGEPLRELPGSYVLLSAEDVPAFGSRTEIMVTPRKTLKVMVGHCINPACSHLELEAGE